VAGGLGYWALRPGIDTAATVQTCRGRARHGRQPPVPVLAAVAQQQDVLIYLDGVGTVQAFNHLQVRPQVDGPLLEVRYRKGQDVACGDVLARIDPRPPSVRSKPRSLYAPDWGRLQRRVV